MDVLTKLELLRLLVLCMKNNRSKLWQDSQLYSAPRHRKPTKAGRLGTSSRLILALLHFPLHPTVLEQPTITVSGDPHFSVLLPTGQLLCYSVHGEKDFSFNLITNDFMVMNARFIPDPTREEVTWIGSLGVVVRAATYGDSNVTKIRFEAGERKVYVGDKATLVADRVERLSIGDGRLVISESSGRKGARRKQHKVFVDLTDYGLSFSVQFVKFHLGLMWRRVYQQPRNSHGLIGELVSWLPCSKYA